MHQVQELPTETGPLRATWGCPAQQLGSAAGTEHDIVHAVLLQKPQEIIAPVEMGIGGSSDWHGGDPLDFAAYEGMVEPSWERGRDDPVGEFASYNVIA
jgi:hypothetical protein